MRYYDDLYGVRADQKTFLEHEEETLSSLVESIEKILDLDLSGTISESQGGIVFRNAIDRESEQPDVEVHLHPNHIIELDDDYWLEERYKEFAWLFEVGSQNDARIEEVRRTIEAAGDLNLTLIRSVSWPEFEGRPGETEVSFELVPETEEK